MNLNKLFQSGGGKMCYAQMPVIGELVNESGGTVIINQPHQEEKPQRAWRPGWSHKLRVPFLGIYFYISNVRMKKRPKRDILFTGFREDHYVENKRKIYERQEHKCPHCGQVFEYDQLENHHYLPVGRFPELQWSIRNMILLCHKCHKEVHMNPWKNIEMMKEKAQEFGIDLNERYELTAGCD